jgi:hypothetical protein
MILGSSIADGPTLFLEGSSGPLLVCWLVHRSPVHYSREA